MSPSNLGMHNHTLREIVADGAETGTFKYASRDTVHAYVALGRHGEIPTMACGIYGLTMVARLWASETMDCHGGPASVTCGRCRRILGTALEAT